MGSKREEERNEKIIRGLMKLPPNRMCINCNSLGPQYVCTNFWTFICMTCSGIHREFTHRVKSVSMSKFTSQEVEALQNGGNQRAREIYLKDWDMQTQRLPSSSNVEKIREFIKNVYVDRRYAGGKSSTKPPRDMQGLKSHEDDTRRASSYHSYSQSPPYDYQYEDRRYGRQVGALSRKPGSDRGHHIARFSSFIGSPGRFSDQALEDRFANEGSAPSASDYSVSSVGDPFRSGRESPSFQKDSGFSSPTLQPSREVLTEDTRHQVTNSFADSNFKRNAQGVPHIQRTASSASTGSFDGKSTSFKSYDTSIMDVRQEPHQTPEMLQDNKSTFQQSSVSMNYGGLDLFSALNSSSTPPTDISDMPALSSVPSTEVFQPATVQTSSHQIPQTAPSIDLFAAIVEHSPTSNMDVKSPELPVPKNEEWATFDAPQPAAAKPGMENHYLAEVPRDREFSLHFNQSSTLNTGVPWPLFEGSAGPASSIPSPWQGGLLNVQAPTVATNTQSWNAFEVFNGHISQEGVTQNHSNVIEAQAYNPSVAVDPISVIGVSEDFNNYGIQGAANHPGSFSPSPSEFGMTVFAPPSTLPLMGENQSHASDHKSINPFDLPFDSDMEQSSMLFDMGSLQAALPNSESSSTFIAGVSEPWFPQNPVTPFIQAAPQSGVAYVVGQSQNSQLPNTPAQEPLASIGGNPFA